MLIFCEDCWNIMVLRERRSKFGIYVCRRCHRIKRVKTRPMKRIENINYIAPSVPL